MAGPARRYGDDHHDRYERQRHRCRPDDCPLEPDRGRLAADRSCGPRLSEALRRDEARHTRAASRPLPARWPRDGTRRGGRPAPPHPRGIPGRRPRPAQGAARSQVECRCPSRRIGGHRWCRGPEQEGAGAGAAGARAGATLAELIAATGWLPHTTRAALSRIRTGGQALLKAARPDAAIAYRIPAPVAPVAAPSRARKPRRTPTAEATVAAAAAA
ncbi:DUF3489 domain-containing protein [Methylobacterium phyllosphaerae]